MKCLGVIALINFSEWDAPDYQEAGGINSVIKNLLPFLKSDKIILYGLTTRRENLFQRRILTEHISVFPILFVEPGSIVPRRVFGFLLGWRLLKYCKVHEVELIYSHSEELCFWLTFSKIPYIHHLHTYVNALEVSGARLAQFKIFRALWGKLRTRVIKNAFKMIAVNSDVTKLGARLIGRERVIEFPNYVDTDKFRHTDFQNLKQKLRLDDKKICLFIGRISAVKGLELFVDVLEMLNNESSFVWIGIIVGTGEYEQSIKTYIHSKKLSDHFIFAGVENDPVELSRYYSMADVFSITSISESVPLTLLESLSCGTPVVSTDIGISKDVLDNRTNGFVCSSRSSIEFSKRVLECLEFKSGYSLLPNQQMYTVKNASELLNKEILGEKGVH